jgi:hypothetical protein
MDGAEGLAAAAVWQLAQELHERQVETLLLACCDLPNASDINFVSGVRKWKLSAFRIAKFELSVASVFSVSSELH